MSYIIFFLSKKKKKAKDVSLLQIQSRSTIFITKMLARILATESKSHSNPWKQLWKSQCNLHRAVIKCWNEPFSACIPCRLQDGCQTFIYFREDGKKSSRPFVPSTPYWPILPSPLTHRRLLTAHGLPFTPGDFRAHPTALPPTLSLPQNFQLFSPAQSTPYLPTSATSPHSVATVSCQATITPPSLSSSLAFSHPHSTLTMSLPCFKRLQWFPKGYRIKSNSLQYTTSFMIWRSTLCLS